MNINEHLKENIYLFIIFLSMSAAIILKSYFNPDGYLSPDSTNYLSVAKNLINGDGYIINQEFRGQPFAIWPIGYPTLIFMFAKITTLSVFWSSKFLNIFFIACIILLIKKTFPNKPYLYAIVLFFSSYIEIYSYSWSETIFILSFLLFNLSIYNLLIGKNYYIFFVFISSLLMFFTRYIGAFSFGITGILGLYYFLYKKNIKISLYLFLIAFLGLLAMCLTLLINYKITGYPTGIPRIKSLESNMELLYSRS